MKLAGLHIDRFGARSNLNLSGIADGLNVVHGPNGSGKTTVIQFIRWMMYGVCDEISQRYLTTAPSPALGTMQVRDFRGTRTLERTHTGHQSSHLTIHNGNQQVQPPTSLPRDEFDRCFSICFDHPRELDELLRSSALRSFEPNNDHRRDARLGQLTSQIAGYRAELNQSEQISATVDALHDRRQAKLDEIDSIRAEDHRCREELGKRRNCLATEISEQQILADRLRSVVVNIDAAIERRAKKLSAAYQQWIAERRESLERRNRRVGEIDVQVTRWQEILQEVQKRLEHLRSRITSIGELSASPAEATDMHAFLKTIGFRFRNIEHDLTGIYENDVWSDHEADANYLRGLLGSALSSVQEDVARLCQTVERQHQSHELHECRAELSCLSRTEQELSDLINALMRQRHQLSREPEVRPVGFDAKEVDQLGSNLQSYFASNDSVASGPSSPAELVNSINDVRLRHLIDRRHAAAAPLHDAELELSNRQRRLRDAEQAIAELGIERRIAVLQRDVAEIDRQLGQIEDRAALERMISSLEEEVRRIRDHWGPSQVVDQANALLRRLTDGEYREMRVAADTRCQVTDRAGRILDYQLLSRGAQDQVYLSLNLAAVAALTRRGIVAPLILNDVFANLDEVGANELVDILVDVAQQGQQVLVFTRHEHIRRRFEPQAARIFTLSGQRERISPPTPAAPPVVVSPRAGVPQAEISPGSPDPTYRWVAERQRSPESHPLIPVTPTPYPEPKHAELPKTTEPGRKSAEGEDEPTNEFTVSLTSPLTQVPTLDVDLIAFLKKIQVEHVETLLELDPDEVETRLGQHGITSEIIQRRQREVLMLVYLGVTPIEAQLLVACGVPDPERLGRADEAVLLKRIEAILDRPQASQRYGNISDYNMARIRNWIDTARRSNYPGRSRPSSLSRSSTSRRAASVEVGAGDSDTVRMQTAPGLRFYLDENAPVVDAPSIGPKTAEKLNEIDIYTVGDLLGTDAATITDQLDDRRVNTDLVRQWQLQSQLVCCIPNLRGHDAQILVACGINEPTTLASLDASKFLAKVTEFVDSKEGQRMIRNSKKPDLAEVTAWIEWADSARQLKAA